MTDVLIYWRDYRKNAERPTTTWHSNSRLLGNLTTDNTDNTDQSI